ncbi:bromodomain-containing protein [Heterostelium album PN500]|uniref:Bromodomain-containing protein n=1 Tax=Heterostelium pallidum (strain ATCC 26659 / Pp 5 / PN500) TaxID=670386 RepID=D3B475_HETP5|nr:bromodomain-containing protein [Heterostelium album PN500]EFA84123.1 bromodomain-containing protein [Heterostelium album PN500]|eukprot:XP_020436240.1 bromodomain-containing protein [Heterostelium album PN500]
MTRPRGGASTKEDDNEQQQQQQQEESIINTNITPSRPKRTTQLPASQKDYVMFPTSNRRASANSSNNGGGSEDGGNQNGSSSSSNGNGNIVIPKRVIVIAPGGNNSNNSTPDEKKRKSTEDSSPGNNTTASPSATTPKRQKNGNTPITPISTKRRSIEKAATNNNNDDEHQVSVHDEDGTETTTTSVVTPKSNLKLTIKLNPSAATSTTTTTTTAAAKTKVDLPSSPPPMPTSTPTAKRRGRKPKVVVQQEKEDDEDDETEDEEEEEEEEEEQRPTPKRLSIKIKMGEQQQQQQQTKSTPTKGATPKVSNAPFVDPATVTPEQLTHMKKTFSTILTQLVKKDLQGYFMEPVTETIAPNYFTHIKEPMDFQTMKEKNQSSQYLSIEQFLYDFTLICENCMTYNDTESSFYKEAKKLLSVGKSMILSYTSKVHPDRLESDIATPTKQPLLTGPVTATPSASTLRERERRLRGAVVDEVPSPASAAAAPTQTSAIEPTATLAAADKHHYTHTPSRRLQQREREKERAEEHKEELPKALSVAAPNSKVAPVTRTKRKPGAPGSTQSTPIIRPQFVPTPSTPNVTAVSMFPPPAVTPFVMPQVVAAPTAVAMPTQQPVVVDHSMVAMTVDQYTSAPQSTNISLPKRKYVKIGGEMNARPQTIPPALKISHTLTKKISEGDNIMVAPFNINSAHTYSMYIPKDQQHDLSNGSYQIIGNFSLPKFLEKTVNFEEQKLKQLQLQHQMLLQQQQQLIQQHQLLQQQQPVVSIAKPIENSHESTASEEGSNEDQPMSDVNTTTESTTTVSTDSMHPAVPEAGALVAQAPMSPSSQILANNIAGSNLSGGGAGVAIQIDDKIKSHTEQQIRKNLLNRIKDSTDYEVPSTIDDIDSLKQQLTESLGGVDLSFLDQIKLDQQQQPSSPLVINNNNNSNNNSNLDVEMTPTTPPATSTTTTTTTENTTIEFAKSNTTTTTTTTKSTSKSIQESLEDGFEQLCKLQLTQYMRGVPTPTGTELQSASLLHTAIGKLGVSLPPSMYIKSREAIRKSIIKSGLQVGAGRQPRPNFHKKDILSPTSTAATTTTATTIRSPETEVTTEQS